MNNFFSSVTRFFGFDNRLKTTEYIVSSKKIPKEFDDFKIVLLADLHSVIPDNLFENVKEINPDVICMSGDTVHHIGSYYPFIELLKQLVKISPVYIVSGNHDAARNDFKSFVSDCKKCGAYFLQNETEIIEKNGEKIIISGMSDPQFAKKPPVINNIKKSLNCFKIEQGFNILLFHRANLINMISQKGFDLILSGHMHGGQVRIPKIGGVLAPKSNFFSGTGLIFPKYSGGRYKISSTELIVSCGIGNRTHIPRLYNRPEIVSIILKTDN